MAQASNELFSVEFFELQLRFAERVAELGEVSLAQAVESHTNIRVRLAMGQLPDAGKADWRDYLARLATAHDKAAWTHAVHVGRLHLSAGPALTHVEGCFSYALIGPDRARLHFHAGDGSAGSPLSAQNRSVRQRELGLLLSKLKAMSPQSMHVVGAS